MIYNVFHLCVLRPVILLALACMVAPALHATQADASPAPPEYDPLRVSEAPALPHIDVEVRDAVRERDVPLRLFLPALREPAPVLLFSHGLGGSRAGSEYLGEHWSKRGYIVICLQHPGSDESVWANKRRWRAIRALKAAANKEQFLARVGDVAFVLDQIGAWNADSEHDLFERIDLARVGMSGHSFGAVTTQAVAGQTFPQPGATFTDERIHAALAFSPSTPRIGKPSAAFGQVSVPWMLMTGTDDSSPIGNGSPESRRLVYSALPETIDRYELVLEGAKHSAFSGHDLKRKKERRDPRHHVAILAVSTAFWDAHLKREAGALEWLRGAGVRSALTPEDGWRTAAARD